MEEIFVWDNFMDTPTYIITDILMGYHFRGPYPWEDEELITQEEIDNIILVYKQLSDEEDHPELTEVLAAVKPFVDKISVLYTKKSGEWLLRFLTAMIDYEDWGDWDELALILTPTRAFALINGEFPSLVLKQALLILYISYPTVEYKDLIAALQTAGINIQIPDRIIYAAIRKFFGECPLIPVFAPGLESEEFRSIFPIIATLSSKYVLEDNHVKAMKESINDVIIYYYQQQPDSLLKALKEFNEINNHVFEPCWWDNEGTFYPHMMYYMIERLGWRYDDPTVTPKIKISDEVFGTVRREIYQWTYTDPVIGEFEVTQQENYYDPNLTPHKFLAEFMLIY